MEERIRSLIDRLNAASEAYYGGKREIMTDYEWDAAFDELSRLEAESGLIYPDSPTQRVSEAPPAHSLEERHEFPALSLAKTKDVGELVKWAGGKPVWCSWKEDGLTLVATYENGLLRRLLTRGNGVTGANVTSLAEALHGIPRRIAETGKLVIRGEAVISYADFEAFLLESGEDYANPRNLASGSLSLKDTDEIRRRHIRFVPFTLVYTERDLPGWGQRLSYLDQLGFETVQRESVPDPDMLPQVISRWSDRADKGLSPYPVDGLVITYDDTVYASGGSVTGHHMTRAGLAFKWADESADTVLERVEWSCAASAITPVAVFRPVRLEGTTVTRSTLHNISECRRLGLGGAGTRIRVIKANKIIPKVIGVLEKQGDFTVPAACPVCGGEVSLRLSASGAETLHCLNASCPARQIRRFARFVSKPGMNIDGLSTQTLVRLINLGLVKEYADLYHLSAHADSIRELEGFGERSVSNLLSSVEKSRDVAGEKLLYALNIPLCGPEVAKLLLSRHSLEEIRTLSREGDGEDVFASIDGIGPEKSAAVVRWFRDDSQDAAFRRLLAEVRVSETDKTPAGTLCQGLVFVITGEVTRFRNRAALKALIEAQGGKVTGSVTKKTDYLINNDRSSGSAKNKKAAELGVPVLSEDELIRRFSLQGSEG